VELTASSNAASESFNSTLEFEPLSRRHFATKAEDRREVAAYNRIRRHSTCEMHSPVEYEAILALRATDKAARADAA
jgi:putative transposase